MPYVDDGESPKKTSLHPHLSIVALILVSPVGAVMWYLSYQWFGMSYPGAILAGLVIGLALKFTLKMPSQPLRVAGVILTVVACVAGYCVVEYYRYSLLIPPPAFDLGQVIPQYFRDIQAILFTAIGAYLAFVLGYPRMPVATHTPAE